MNRFSCPLRAEELAIIAAITLIILLGIGWGLPSKKRMDLLLDGGAPTPRQVQLMNSLHRLHALDQLVPDSLPPRRWFDGTVGTLFPQWYSSRGRGPALALTETERLYSLRAYILGSSAIDEQATLIGLGRMNPRTLNFNAKLYGYGGSYLYPLGFVCFLMKSVGLLHVTQDFAYYLHNPSQVAHIYLAGRLLNLLALIGTLIVLALLGRLLSSQTAGTLSLLAYGLATVVLNHTVVMKPHVFTAFWVALATYLLILYVHRRVRRLLVFSILAAGYAVGSSLPAAAMGLLYPVLLFERRRGSQFVQECLGAWAGMATVFLVMNPYSILEFKEYSSALSGIGSTSGWGFAMSKLPQYVHGAFVTAYTFPVGLLGLAFMLWCCLRRSGQLQRLALATAAFIVIFGTCYNTVRITTFLGPLFCLFGGIAVAEWIAGPLRTRKLLRASLIVLLYLPGVVFAGLFARDTIWDMNWYEPTARWVHSAHIGPRTTIGVFSAPNPVDLPPFPFLHAHLVDMNVGAAAAALPDYVIVGNYTERTRRLWLNHPLRSRYRLLYDLGYRPSYDWFRGERYGSESQTAGFVYQRVDR